MNTFERFAPFIRDYIYAHRWDELREIQVAAAQVIFDTDGNLLLSTPTASGKTEAAFLPIITEIYNNPPSSVGVLYIAPLKALINDQFGRIEELLQYADIPVTKWHGDALQSAKTKLLKMPRGVLQITPESLEAMLMLRKQHITALFADLRFVVIDEMHNLLGEDRGVQLSSILERIQSLTNNIPRRIGLSATLGDIAAAQEWLSGDTNRKCSAPETSEARRKSQIMVSHFFTDENDENSGAPVPFYESLYQLTRGRKCIVFCNARSDVERNINKLKLMARSKNENDVYHAHHGNISKDMREYAEDQMRDSETAPTIGATVTLELGIDIGDLERIIQLGSPHSVSSLAQRLGRSGRKSGVSQMCFMFNEEPIVANTAFYNAINWQFVKCIALIELYRQQWIEPVAVPKLPYNILVHQTISFLYSYGETTPQLLAQKMLNKYAFKHIPADDYKILLRYLIEKGVIEHHEDKILLGEKGEWLANGYDIYSVFVTEEEYSVRDGAQEIGTLTQPLPIGERFVLTGRTWEVKDVDKENKTIYVEYYGGASTVSFIGEYAGNYSTKVLQQIREVLRSNDIYAYLTDSAVARLNEIRQTARNAGICDHKLCRIAPDKVAIFPWLGTKALNALRFSLMVNGCDVLSFDSTWYMVVVKGKTESDIVKILDSIKSEPINANDLPLPDEINDIGKYGEFVPEQLKRKQFAKRFIDVHELVRELRQE